MTKLTALAIGIHECLHMFQNSLCGNCHPPLQTDNSAKNTNFHQLQNQKYTTINTIGKQTKRIRELIYNHQCLCREKLEAPVL